MYAAGRSTSPHISWFIANHANLEGNPAPQPILKRNGHQKTKSSVQELLVQNRMIEKPIVNNLNHIVPNVPNFKVYAC